MKYTLKWTPRSILTFDSNVAYLQKEWTDEVLRNFLKRVSDALEKIQDNPHIYSLHDPAKRIHRCVIHERIVLYYRVKASTIDLLVFWNTYQNPLKLKV